MPEYPASPSGSQIVASIPSGTYVPVTGFAPLAQSAAFTKLGLTAFDTFDRADSASALGTADSGHAYTVRAGTLGISANQAYTTTDTEGAADIDAGVIDALVGADFYVGDASGDHGLKLNVADANNYLVVNMRSTGFSDIRIGKVVAGVYTQLNLVSKTFTVGVTYRLEVRVSTNRIIVYVDGVQQSAYYLTAAEVAAFKTLSNTRFGWYLKRQAWRVDRFSVNASGRVTARSQTIEHKIVLDPVAGTRDNFDTNVAMVQNLANNGISAIRFLRDDSHERGAIGFANSGAFSPWASKMFIESSALIKPDGTTDNTQPAPALWFGTHGVINGTYGEYVRQEFLADGSTNWYNIATYASVKKILSLDQINIRVGIGNSATGLGGAGFAAALLDVFGVAVFGTQTSSQGIRQSTATHMLNVLAVPSETKMLRLVRDTVVKVDFTIQNGGVGNRLEFTDTDNSSKVPLTIYLNGSGKLGTYDGGGLVLGATTGFKIGTAATEKLGFWNATPVVQQARPTDAASIITLLTTLGLCA